MGNFCDLTNLRYEDKESWNEYFIPAINRLLSFYNATPKLASYVLNKTTQKKTIFIYTYSLQRGTFLDQ